MAYKIVPSISQILDNTVAINNFEDIEKGVNILINSQCVYLYALGSSILAAKELNLKLLRLSKKSLFLEDSNFTLQTLACATLKDSLVLVSYSGNTDNIKVALKKAKDKGMRVILITRYSQNPIIESVDLTLYCPNVSRNDARLLAFVKKYSQLFLTDLLFIGFAKSISPNPEKTIVDYMDKYFFI